MMKTTLHRAESRGHADHGWLDTHHTFSFANYYDPSRMHFGVLRVLNDDIVSGGRGFGTHPHENMEIISIPLEGDLEHKDSMGNTFVIKENDIQVMSAGTGVSHSEYNRNEDRRTNFLQIWIYPREKDVEPRYDQVHFSPEERKNKLQQLLSPNKDDEGVWIHQDAWIHRGSLEEGTSVDYTIRKSGNGLYLFVIEGEIEVGDIRLSRRDGLGIQEAEEVKLTAKTESDVLLIEIPMDI